MVKTSMFTRARLQMPLTPSERAFLKVLKGLVLSALMAGATAAWPLLQSTAINWRLVGVTGGVSVAFTLFSALDKYWTSQGDLPLAGVAGAIAQALPTTAPVVAPVASPTANLGAATAAPVTSNPAPATVTTGASNI